VRHAYNQIQKRIGFYTQVRKRATNCFYSKPQRAKIVFLWNIMIRTMKVLGIETSCDETGVALYDSERGLIGQLLHSQIDLHKEYGGVVPELASRDHIRKLTPLTEKLLVDCRLEKKDINGVAYTAGPGLMGALMVGATFGRTLAWALNIPAIEVNHMEGHLLSPLLSEIKQPPLPFLALLVSGGHSQIILVQNIGQYHLIGESLDDAAGEAFDKTAKIMGLGYPGGPALSSRALTGESGKFVFPRPMTDQDNLNMSFSGLKTYARNAILANAPLTEQDTADLCKAFEEAVVETLLIKCKKALKDYSIKHLVIAGGVSANSHLRECFDSIQETEVYYPPLNYCTDNGAMIALAGTYRLLSGETSPLAISTRARWPISSLSVAVPITNSLP